jgi:uncharacterized protein YecE (DUF72 family)
MAAHIGTMGWSYGFWKGNFYPEDLSSKEFLGYYSKQFGTVEVDSTFYRIPRKTSVTNWKDQTPTGFLFSLKFPQVITHIKMLKNCQEETSVFLEHVNPLREKLGVLLLQFPYTFKAEQIPLLSDFLPQLPKTHRYAVEVRNRKILNDELYITLRQNDVALAWVDSPYMPEINEVTSNFIYIRWEGNRKKVIGTLGKRETDKTPQIKIWANKIKPFIKKQTEIYGYFSKYYTGYPTSDAKNLLNLLGYDNY